MLDAAEATALRAVIEAVGPKRGKDAWRAIRDDFRQARVAQARRIWAVVDLILREHSLATNTRQLADAVAIERPVQVIALVSEVREAERRFADAVAAARADGATVSRLRRSAP